MKKQTRVLIADGAIASVLAYSDLDNRLELVKGGDLSHINKPTRELVSTKRGRVFNSADGSRSAMARPTDPHMLEKKMLRPAGSGFSIWWFSSIQAFNRGCSTQNVR